MHRWIWLTVALWACDDAPDAVDVTADSALDATATVDRGAIDAGAHFADLAVDLGVADATPPDAATVDAAQPPDGACAAPSPAGCADDDACPDGAICEPRDPDVECRPSACECVGGAWACTPDCGGGRCVAQACAEPNPAGCTDDSACGAAQRCALDPQECLPSSCVCEAGAWGCREDCGGGRCVDAGPCGPNPAGCAQVPCPDGQQCIRDPEGCAPSRCDCDATSGRWRCTRDCAGGGVCRDL